MYESSISQSSSAILIEIMYPANAVNIKPQWQLHYKLFYIWYIRFKTSRISSST